MANRSPEYAIRQTPYRNRKTQLNLQAPQSGRLWSVRRTMHPHSGPADPSDTGSTHEVAEYLRNHLPITVPREVRILEGGLPSRMPRPNDSNAACSLRNLRVTLQVTRNGNLHSKNAQWASRPHTHRHCAVQPRPGEHRQTPPHRQLRTAPHRLDAEEPRSRFFNSTQSQRCISGRRAPYTNQTAPCSRN